jgi:hypothetical protein
MQSSHGLQSTRRLGNSSTRSRGSEASRKFEPTARPGGSHARCAIDESVGPWVTGFRRAARWALRRHGRAEGLRTLRAACSPTGRRTAPWSRFGRRLVLPGESGDVVDCTG